MQGTELKNHVLALCDAVETISVAGSSMLGSHEARSRSLRPRDGQPAAPDTAEVERLVHELDHAAYRSGHAAASRAEPRGIDTQRSALLDYVRGFIAERDQFRDAAKMVPDANDPDPLHLSRILHELAGAASMCWTPKPSTAVFDSQQAIAFVEQAIAEIRRRMQMMSAAPQPVGEPCRVDQPAGWRCTRANGHKGPCAAVEDRA